MANDLLPVEPAIYRNRNIQAGTYYAECVKNDLISRIDAPLRRAGYHLSFDGLYRKLANSVGTDTPWHHVKHLGTKRCGIDHRLKFGELGYVPPRCMECWKVVAGPRTLKELFALLEVQKGLNRASKCGIEMRHYTPRFYGGYFYNNSLDEGRERYEEVRKAVDEHISKDMPVILKRACTEFEMVLGPSVAWHMTPAQHEIDNQLENMIDMAAPNAVGQTDECLSKVHTSWMEWAWRVQDPTAKEYIGDIPLYSKTMTYHEGDLDEIKADICRARAMVKHGIDSDTTDSIKAALRGFSLTKRVGLDKMAAVLGFDKVSPLYMGGADYAG